MVWAMRDEYVDPSGNTQQFRAFALAEEPPPSRPVPTGLLVTGVLMILGAVAAVAWLALG